VKSVNVRVAKIMERAGVPKALWDHTIIYVVELNNRLVHPTPRLKNRTPWEYIFGSTPDLSAFTIFAFYDRVWYISKNSNMPEDRGRIGRWLGPSKSLTPDLVYKVLTIDCLVIHTSLVQPIILEEEDTDGVKLLIKEYDISVHKKMPFIKIDIE